MSFNAIPTTATKKDPLQEMVKFRGTKQDSIRIGKQTVEKGCANLYGSDPNKEWTDDRPGSPTFGQKVPVPSFTVCGDTKVDGDELMALGFDRKGIEQPDMVGVTFVETGEDCWLTLYDNSNFDGDSTIIAPMTAAPLVKVGEHAWDDVTRSLTSSVKPHIADGTAIALFMPGGTALGDMNPHCVGLLEDSPKRNPGATGFYLCGDVTKAKKWIFTQNDIINSGYGVPIDGGDHLEVDYIMTGAAVKLKVYDGNNADSWFQDALKVGESGELDLKNSEYKKNDEKETWADVVKSFVLYTSESDETALFAADWNKDYKKCDKPDVDCGGNDVGTSSDDNIRKEQEDKINSAQDSNMGGGGAAPHRDSFADPMENPTKMPSHVPGNDDLGTDVSADANSNEPDWKIKQEKERAASRAKRAAKEDKDAPDADASADADSNEPDWKIEQEKERAASRAKRAAKEGKDVSSLSDDERHEKKLEALEDYDSNMGGGGAPDHQDSFADPMENPTRMPSHTPGNDDLAHDDATGDADANGDKPCDNNTDAGSEPDWKIKQDKERAASRAKREKDKNKPPVDVDGYDGAGLSPTHEPTAVKTDKPHVAETGIPLGVPTIAPTLASTDAEPALTGAPTTAGEPEWKIRQDEERAASRAKIAKKEEKAKDTSGEPEWKIRQDEERAASRAKRAEHGHGGDSSEPVVSGAEPTHVPTFQPTDQPSREPVNVDTDPHTKFPTMAPVSPTTEPTYSPVADSTNFPTAVPIAKTFPTLEPTKATGAPTLEPTEAPQMPTKEPTDVPIAVNTSIPTFEPTDAPVAMNTSTPTFEPTEAPVVMNTTAPTASKNTKFPTLAPITPSMEPSSPPVLSKPKGVPTAEPTYSPVADSTSFPIAAKTEAPVMPTASPLIEPTLAPTDAPVMPTKTPTEVPVSLPTSAPVALTTHEPTAEPTVPVTGAPSMEPTDAPLTPTKTPSLAPVAEATDTPVALTTHEPTAEPTVPVTGAPSMEPTDAPLMPTKTPSLVPVAEATDAPVVLSSHEPTAEPSVVVTGAPTEEPIISSTHEPTAEPTAALTQGTGSPTLEAEPVSTEPTAYVPKSSEPTAYVPKSIEPTAYMPKSSEPTAFVKASILPTHSPVAEADVSMCNARMASASQIVPGVSYPPMGCSTFFWEDANSSNELYSTFCTCRELGQLDIPLSIFAYPNDSPAPDSYPPVHTIVSGWNTSLTVEAPYIHGSTTGPTGSTGTDRLVIGPREVTTIEKLEEKAGSGTWTGRVNSIQLMGWNNCGHTIDCNDVTTTLKRRYPKAARNRSRRRLVYVEVDH
jgi:hypothetical protein